MLKRQVRAALPGLPGGCPPRDSLHGGGASPETNSLPGMLIMNDVDVHVTLVVKPVISGERQWTDSHQQDTGPRVVVPPRSVAPAAANRVCPGERSESPPLAEVTDGAGTAPSRGAAVKGPLTGP